MRANAFRLSNLIGDNLEFYAGSKHSLKAYTYWKETETARSDFFLQSSRIRVNLLSYESKLASKREQYDWMPEKMDG